MKSFFKKSSATNAPAPPDGPAQLIESYIKGGRVPWSKGYNEYRWREIENALRPDSDGSVPAPELSSSFGKGLDERIIEYRWIFSRLAPGANNLLDAGSTFNFAPIVNHPLIGKKELTIFTYHPEPLNFSKKRISYVYGDLRDMPFRNELFKEIVCQSTIEHIDMDNSIYGYDKPGNDDPEKKSYEYMKAVAELDRVLAPGGKLLLTFPYGSFEHHGFFQQFDSEMVDRIVVALNKKGSLAVTFFRYMPEGWKNVSRLQCDDAVSYNPHTGRGKGDDGAAHCRGICCIEFVKNK